MLPLAEGEGDEVPDDKDCEEAPMLDPIEVVVPGIVPDEAPLTELELEEPTTGPVTVDEDEPTGSDEAMEDEEPATPPFEELDPLGVDELPYPGQAEVVSAPMVTGKQPAGYSPLKHA